jgi:alpha-amylase/alpha-mannosidase (GH57 family)
MKTINIFISLLYRRATSSIWQETSILTTFSWMSAFPKEWQSSKDIYQDIFDLHRPGFFKTCLSLRFHTVIPEWSA